MIGRLLKRFKRPRELRIHLGEDLLRLTPGDVIEAKGHDGSKLILTYRADEGLELESYGPPSRKHKALPSRAL